MTTELQKNRDELYLYLSVSLYVEDFYEIHIQDYPTQIVLSLFLMGDY